MNYLPKHIVQCLLLLCIIATANHAQADSLTASVNRSSITLDQALILTLRYDGAIDAQQIDLSPLNKDFEVLNTRPQSNSNIAIINGQQTVQNSTVWQIGLAAKGVGKLLIPALNIGAQSSQAITIDVAPIGTEIAQAQPLKAILAANKKQALVGEQILVTLKLIADTNVGDISGNEPSVSNGRFEELNKANTSTVIDGIAKQVLTYNYALFPDAAGEITIPAMTYQARVGGRRSLFDSFSSRGQRVIARTRATTISIKPPVKKDAVPWFNADNVGITTKWSPDISEAKVGEPLTRTIAIVAQGQKAAAIPPLAGLDDTTQFRAYGDQAQLDNRKNSRGFTGTRTESTAIVPTQAGDITLPEQRLNWWSNKSQSWQEILVPAQTISVAAGSVPSDGVPINPNVAVSDVIVDDVDNDNFPWQWLSYLLALICIVQSYFLFARRPRKATSPSKSKNTANAAWNALQTAIKGGDAWAIRNAVINWSKQAQPQQSLHTLQSLADLIDDSDHALRQLNDHLYKGEEFDRDKFAQAINAVKQQLSNQAQPQQAGDLAPLYPS